MDIETVNGSVTLGLPSDAHADLNVLNMNGSFSSELPITAKDWIADWPRIPREAGNGRRRDSGADRERRNPICFSKGRAPPDVNNEHSMIWRQQLITYLFMI